MNTEKTTRSIILDEAQNLLQKQSISGVSFQELAKRVGIKKGSMYYHFESKDDLAVALLERATEKLASGFEQGKSLPPEKQLRNFLGYYRKTTCENKKICFGGVFAAEWDTQSEPVHTAVKQTFTTMIQGVANIISIGVKDGVFNDHNRDHRELAEWIITNIQGALLTSRVIGDATPFESMESITMSYLKP